MSTNERDLSGPTVTPSDNLRLTVGSRRRRRGTGSIYRPGDGGWMASIRLADGRRIKRRAPDYPEAKHQLAMLLREYRDQLSRSYRPWRRSYKRESIRRSLRFQILERDGFRCVYCGATAKQAELHVDHIVPVVSGGTDDPSNLATACVDCNLGKAAIQLWPAA